ncbi:hypothetical protein GCM10017559_82390 [Streptosporangium longisporum]|uniref:Secreted protein n=1 Tax=Streptosporangium longisporum TaxID=46187 RepID=A0ABP6LJF1_9ACTN
MLVLPVAPVACLAAALAFRAEKRPCGAESGGGGRLAPDDPPPQTARATAIVDPLRCPAS